MKLEKGARVLAVSAVSKRYKDEGEVIKVGRKWVTVRICGTEYRFDIRTLEQEGGGYCYVLYDSEEEYEHAEKVKEQYDVLIYRLSKVKDYKEKESIIQMLGDKYG